MGIRTNVTQIGGSTQGTANTEMSTKKTRAEEKKVRSLKTRSENLSRDIFKNKFGDRRRRRSSENKEGDTAAVKIIKISLSRR